MLHDCISQPFSGQQEFSAAGCSHSCIDSVGQVCAGHVRAEEQNHHDLSLQTDIDDPHHTSQNSCSFLCRSNFTDLTDNHKENQGGDEDEDRVGDWIENEELSDNLREKILALKVCRNCCLAHAESDTAAEIATPVLKMLATLVEHEGSLIPNIAEELALNPFKHFIFSTITCFVNQSKGESTHASSSSYLLTPLIDDQNLCYCNIHQVLKISLRYTGESL